ncbi:hypothetical protein LTR08_006301 [Meristemomyces frigidus]|nr:hypothetical protein LTR08_006301 [Meristemomyces frigidus]
MAIQQLENTVIRTIGASQVLTDPATLVKELIDNALDAQATSIAIEIHSNTLDVIQLRDNGHGIASEDRPMVATPNCTSKLVDIDDLKDLGGSSLGFRGQALASAAELSGSLTISTRVEGEQVATALKISQRGEVVGQDRASLPVGTTVRITDFIKAQPVRRQVALKNIDKCLRKIKQTCQAYAFARPHVRMSLRVLKAKNDKGNWMYAPKPGGSVEDAALKIVGSACASQCIWTVVEEAGFSLQAFLPRPDAEPSKVSNFGAFISIDARPLSATRGTLKQVVKIFRESLKAAAGSDHWKDPFIYLRIMCPSASYDPNIEPAKDDVLFEDPDVVVGAVRRLFADVYPDREPVAIAAPSNMELEERPTAEPALPGDCDDDFVTSLEQPFEGQERNMPALAGDDGVGLDQARPQRSYRSNMYGCDEEDMEFLDARPPTGRTEADFEELRQARNDVSVSNPWVVAKLNATLRQPVSTEEFEDTQEVQTAGINAVFSSPIRASKRRERLEAHGLPTPRASSPSPPMEFHPSDHVPDLRLARDGRLIGSQSLPPPQMLVTPHPTRYDEDDISETPPARRQADYNYGLTPQTMGPPADTPLHAIPNAGQRTRHSPRNQPQHGQLNRPFVSPVVQQSPRDRVWFDHLEDEGRPPRRKPRQSYPTPEGLVRQGELGDLIDDPRTLTPPRRNRDIRDFVGSVDLTDGDNSAASLIEGRHYGCSNVSRSVHAHTMDDHEDGGENVSPTKAALSSRGFMPASELVAMEARVGPLTTHTSPARPPTKRRKTSEGRALREVSANAAAPAEDIADANDDDESHPKTANRASSSRRRRTTEAGATGKVHRTKSSRLPLETVPKGQMMNTVALGLATSVEEISRSAGRVDEESSLLGWNEPALDARGVFANEFDDGDLRDLSARLRELLGASVEDGEVVEDLDEVLRGAFAVHGSEVEVMAVDEMAAE